MSKSASDSKQRASKRYKATHEQLRAELKSSLRKLSHLSAKQQKHFARSQLFKLFADHA